MPGGKRGRKTGSHIDVMQTPRSTKPVSEEMDSNLKLMQGLRKAASNKESSSVMASATIPKEISLWLSGILPTPPEGVKSALSDISEKMTWVVAYNTVCHLARVSKLFDALERVEGKIYDDDVLDTYSTRELMQLQTKLQGDLLNVLEFARKFIAQNQEVISQLSRSKDELLEHIRHLDSYTLAALRDALRGV